MGSRAQWLIVMLMVCEWMVAGKKGASTDTARVYRNIETLAMKSKPTKFMYGLVLRPVDSLALRAKPKKSWVSTQSYYEYEGKIIRRIDIKTIDPFGNTLTDTLGSKMNFLYYGGNKYHKKTMRLTIKNLLLFEKDEPLDALLLKESERLIRSQNYVRDVAFKIVPVAEGSDSVDIYIRELDVWTLMPRVELTGSGSTFRLTEKNFVGTGHELMTEYTKSFDRPTDGYAANYVVPNIKNSYINTRLHYEVDQYENSSKSVGVDRPFYSGLAIWAGGAEYGRFYKNDSINYENNEYASVDTEFEVQDYWGGLAFQAFKGNSDYNRTTNFVLSGRYERVRYDLKPLTIYDPDELLSNEDYILGSFGLSSRQYIQSKYIYNYGVTEDVPMGMVASVTGGYQYKNGTERLYLGGRLGYGAFKRWGFISVNGEYGSYFRSAIAEQSVFTAEVNYFTNLIVIGEWKFRQFVRPKCVIGANRFVNEYITLNNGEGIRGFNGTLTGSKKVLLSLQTQSYAPWNVAGFRFGPYVTAAFGVIGNESESFRKSHIYSQFGIGCLIKNDFLVLNTFQISFAFYPTIPGQGHNIVKLNPINTSDYQFTDFTLGKPSIVKYK